MKKIRKILLGIIGVVLIVVIYFYSKPAVYLEQLKVEKDVPIKIQWKGKNQISVHIPYKFKISNNRLEKLRIEYIHDSLSSYSFSDLMFDANGYKFSYHKKAYDIDSLLLEKKVFQYLNLYSNSILLPFLSREIYFYREKKLNVALPHKDIDAIIANFKAQRKKLKPMTKGIDYKNLGIKTEDLHFINNKLYFHIEPTKPKYKSFSKYKIYYNLKNDKQEIENIYKKTSKMTKHEMIEYLNSSSYDFNFNDSIKKLFEIE